MNSSNPNYSIFEDVLKTIPCYSVVRSDVGLFPSNSNSPLEFKQKCDFSDINNQYFLISEDPIISRQCRFYQYVDHHSKEIRFYGYRIVGSLLIVTLIYVMILMIKEVSNFVLFNLFQ